jgi:hypothetical protein
MKKNRRSLVSLPSPLNLDEYAQMHCLRNEALGRVMK